MNKQVKFLELLKFGLEIILRFKKTNKQTYKQTNKPTNGWIRSSPSHSLTDDLSAVGVYTFLLLLLHLLLLLRTPPSPPPGAFVISFITYNLHFLSFGRSLQKK